MLTMLQKYEAYNILTYSQLVRHPGCTSGYNGTIDDNQGSSVELSEREEI